MIYLKQLKKEFFKIILYLNVMSIDFKKKYLKYKKKYLFAKKIKGGSNNSSIIPIDNLRTPSLYTDLTISTISSVDSFVDIKSLPKELTIEDLKYDDINHFIFVYFTSKDICDFLLFEVSTLIPTNKIFIDYFDLILNKYKNNYYDIFDDLLEKNLKDKIKDDNLITELLGNMDSIFKKAFHILEIIVTKNYKLANENEFDLLQSYIRVVKYKEYILGYYRYHLNFNYKTQESIDEEINLSNLEKVNFFELIKKVFGEELPFNVIYIANRCSFSRVDKIYPFKYETRKISEIYEEYKQNIGRHSIGNLLWNDIKNIVSCNSEFSQKPSAILFYIDDDTVESYHKRHGSFLLKNYNYFTDIFDEMTLYISKTFDVEIEKAILIKKYLFYIMDSTEIWANLISLKEKEERNKY